MDIKKLLGQKIKNIRKEKGYTQEKFSEMINISHGLEQYYSFINDEFRLINLIAFIFPSPSDYISNSSSSTAEVIRLPSLLVDTIASDSIHRLKTFT